MFALFGSTSSLEIFPPSVIDLFLEMTWNIGCYIIYLYIGIHFKYYFREVNTKVSSKVSDDQTVGTDLHDVFSVHQKIQMKDTVISKNKSITDGGNISKEDVEPNNANMEMQWRRSRDNIEKHYILNICKVVCTFCRIETLILFYQVHQKSQSPQRGTLQRNIPAICYYNRYTRCR
jgi:hypothetical protein